jgi:hypothetical protein
LRNLIELSLPSKREPPTCRTVHDRSATFLTCETKYGQCDS